MTDLLHTVTELTDLRDKRELDAMFAEIIHALVGPCQLVLWRKPPGGQDQAMQRRITLPEPAPETAAASAPPSLCRQVFVIPDGQRPDGALEILRPAPLSRAQALTVSRLIRVYGNHAKLLEYGHRDELTGLFNRRSFNSHFRLLLQATPTEAVIAVADIDFFKRINDEFGHLYRDEVLILMARLMESCLSEGGEVFRIGGEEFLALLTMPLELAAIRLKAFRHAAQTAIFPQVGRVTVSIGFSAPRQGDTSASAFGRADDALYVAKQRGRNQVQCREWLVQEGVLQAQKKTSGQVELF